MFKNVVVCSKEKLAKLQYRNSNKPQGFYLVVGTKYNPS